jgi:hypothetical protein
VVEVIAEDDVVTIYVFFFGSEFESDTVLILCFFVARKIEIRACNGGGMGKAAVIL